MKDEIKLGKYVTFSPSKFKRSMTALVMTLIIPLFMLLAWNYAISPLCHWEPATYLQMLYLLIAYRLIN